MKIKSQSILLIFTFLLVLTSVTEGLSQQIIINEDPVIRDLMNKYQLWNQEESTVQGWRIQIINTDDRRKMEAALKEFREIYPDIKYVKWKQLSPYYKVIIGAFETKLDVLAFLQELKEYFPSAIPVIEKIEKKELLKVK